jgi:hypothetical protein
MLKYIGFIIYTILCFLAGYYFGQKGLKTFKPKPVTIYDSTLVQKWEKKIQRDTVVKLLDRIVLKEIQPRKVNYQKVDSLYLKKIEKLNTIIGVNKKGDSLKVLSVNFDKKTAREFSFPSSLKEFTLIAQSDDIFYAENRNIFEFQGISLGGGINYEFKDSRKSYFFELMTGFKIFNKVQIKFLLNSNFESGFRIYYNF